MKELENLTNHGIIDLMHHDLTRFKSVNSLSINPHALWQRWLRR